MPTKWKEYDKQGFLDEIQHYNNAVQRGIKFDPNVKDGRGTTGLEINKSNWASTLDEGPFEAYHITCGITFTFGGIRVDPKTSQVINDDLEPIQGLYAAGELVGGLFTSIIPEAQASCPVRSSAARQETLRGSFDRLRFLHAFCSLKSLKKNDPLFPSPTWRSKVRTHYSSLTGF